MRKQILLTIAILGFALGGCDKESDDLIDVTKSSINLIAPNGQRIAVSVEALTNLVTKVVEEKYGENKDVKIDDVIYHDASYGFIAEIRYETYDGHFSNMIMSNISLDDNLDIKRIKTRGEGGNTDGVTIYSCKNEDRGKCPDCEVSKVNGEFNCFCSKGDRKYCKLQKKSR